jgi:hypothetical protein
MVATGSSVRRERMFSNTGSIILTMIGLLRKQDQSEWQIEWQIVLARACLGLASAGVR